MKPLSASLCVVPLALVASLATSIAAQTCEVKNHFRIVTSMSGANPGELRVDSGWQTAAPLVTPGSITTSNALGCQSSASCTSTSDYGYLRCVAAGTANNCPSNGVFLWLDEWIGGEPKAQFHDTLTVVSSTLPAGTPVQVRMDLALAGTAGVNDPMPLLDYRAEMWAYGGTYTLTVSNAAGVASRTFNATVGATITVVGRLHVTIRAQGVMSTTPLNSSFGVDLTATTGIVCQTPGASLASCSGRVYGTLTPTATAVGVGCGQGPPQLSANGAQIGGPLTHSLTGGPANQPVFFGFAPGEPVSIPLGRCRVLIDQVTAQIDLAGVTDPNGQWTQTLTIPAWPSLAGAIFTTQVLVLVPGGPLFGTAELSNGVRLTIGA